MGSAGMLSKMASLLVAWEGVDLLM
jgi:hypothetical protein